jgi:propanol-preferring alcohol dehydrogenase
MRAMIQMAPKTSLQTRELDPRDPGLGQLRVRVNACGACRTDLHVIDSELPDIKYPIVPGHEIISRVDSIGEGVAGFKIDDRVGIPWLAYACAQAGIKTNDVIAMLLGAAVLQP